MTKHPCKDCTDVFNSNIIFKARQFNYTNALDTITNRMNNTKIVPVEVHNAAAPNPAPPPP